jgi:hypothetical protein
MSEYTKRWVMENLQADHEALEEISKNVKGVSKFTAGASTSLGYF